MRYPKADIEGERFGRLVAISNPYRDKNNCNIWMCICDCGAIHFVSSGNLINGKTKSCGCFKKDKITTHGKWNTSIYKVWGGMIQRCQNPKNIAFKWYGGKGIKVCKAWKDFPVFEKWAIANGYKKGITIDRINPFGDYEPINCRWITRSDNSKRANRSRWDNEKYLKEKTK